MLDNDTLKKNGRNKLRIKIFIFFLRHIDKLDWKGISRNELLAVVNIEFFEKHPDKLDWF